MNGSTWRRLLLPLLALFLGVLLFNPLRKLVTSQPRPPMPPQGECDARQISLNASNGERKVAALKVECVTGSTQVLKTLKGADIQLFPRQGEAVAIHAENGTLADSNGITLKLTGHVTLKWHDVTLTGEELFYNDSQDIGHLTGAGGLEGHRGPYRLTSPKADFDLATGIVLFPAGLSLDDPAAGKQLTAGSGRYLQKDSRLELSAPIHGTLPNGELETASLIEETAGELYHVILSDPFVITSHDGTRLAATSGTLDFRGGSLEAGRLNGGKEPVSFETARPLRMHAPTVLFAAVHWPGSPPAGKQADLEITADGGASLAAEKEPQLRYLNAPQVKALLKGGETLADAEFSGGGKGTGPGGEFTAQSGSYDFTAQSYKLSGATQVKRATDFVQADTLSGDMLGNAAGEGHVSGRRGSGETAWRFSGDRATLKAAGPILVSATGAVPAQASQPGKLITARELEVDPKLKRYAARGKVEMRQEPPGVKTTLRGESLDLDEMTGKGKLAGEVFFQQPGLKALGEQADFEFKNSQVTRVVLTSPEKHMVFAESPAYRVTGEKLLYEPGPASGEIFATPPQRVTTLDLTNRQSLSCDHATFSEAGKQVVCTSANGGRTRKEPAPR
jgi:hypothetical protein